MLATFDAGTARAQFHPLKSAFHSRLMSRRAGIFAQALRSLAIGKVCLTDSAEVADT